MNEIIHLCYTSAACRRFGRQELEGLLEHARSFNATRDVTGVLLHHEGGFLQFLEGPQSGIDDVYRRILLSTRHKDIFVLLDGPAYERVFPDWRMGSTGVPESAVLSLRSASWSLLDNPEGAFPTLSPGLLLLRAHFSHLRAVS